MNLRTTFILAILFMIFGTFAIFDPMKWKDKKQEKQEMETRVFWWKDAKLEWLEMYQESGRKTIRIECTKQDIACELESPDAQWKITEPVQDTGDETAISSFLAAVKNLTPVEQVNFAKEGISPSEYGLDKPSQVLKLKLKSQEVIDVKLGTKSAIGSNIYLHTSSNPEKLFLVATYFPDLMKKEVIHWRNKRLFPDVKTENVSEISWEHHKNGRFKFSKNEQNEWGMDLPIKVRAHDVMIGGLVSTIAYLNANSVLDEFKDSRFSQGELKKAKKIFTVTIKTADKKEASVSFFEKSSKEKNPNKKEFLAFGSGRSWLAFTDAMPLNRFDKAANSYRDSRLLPLAEKNKVASIRFKFPRDKKQTLLVKNGFDWTFKEGDSFKGPISQPRVKNFLDALGSAEIKAFEKSEKKFKKWQNGAIDLALSLLSDDAKEIKHYNFILEDRKLVMTNGDLPSEVKIMGEDFVKVLPVRLLDLEESANKQVTLQPSSADQVKDAHGDH